MGHAPRVRRIRRRRDGARRVSRGGLKKLLEQGARGVAKQGITAAATALGGPVVGGLIGRLF